MKNKISLFLKSGVLMLCATLLIVSVFCGCSNDKNKGDSKPKEESSDSSSSVPSKENKVEETPVVPKEVGSAKELYDTLSTAKSGDIIYLKTGDYEKISLPSSFSGGVTIIGKERVTADCIVTNTFTTFPKNMVFKNISFYGTGFSAYLVEVDTISFIDCKFDKGTGISILKNTAKNITIENCIFKGTVSDNNPIIFSDLINAVIKNNTVESSGYNAIQTADADGEILIEGNKISNTNSRALRFNVRNSAKFTIKNNTFTNTDNMSDTDIEERGEIIKIYPSSDNPSAVIKVEASGNTHNGNKMVFNEGIAREAGK